jgi:hypothetical protein
LPEVEFDEAGFPSFDAERAMSLPSTREGAPANPIFAERLVPADEGSPALQPPPQYLPTHARHRAGLSLHAAATRAP